MQDVTSINIIEKDHNNDTLWVWTFPSITETKKTYILKKNIFLPTTFLYSQYEKEFFYIKTSESTSDALPMVKSVALVIWSKELNPDKYERFTSVLCSGYLKTGDPTHVLKTYLATLPEDPKRTIAKTPRSFKLQDLIKTFGLETILIYTTILLKKRLVVYHHSLQDLLEVTSTFPLLMIHRRISDTFYPWLEASEDLSQLKGKSGYVAGFCDNSILTQTDIYDVLVNLPAREITVSPQAKESLSMTKVHKDIALFMVEMANEAEEDQIATALSGKTKEILDQIRSFGEESDNGRYLVSLKAIKDKKFSPTLENFLIQLSIVEDLLKV